MKRESKLRVTRPAYPGYVWGSNVKKKPVAKQKRKRKQRIHDKKVMNYTEEAVNRTIANIMGPRPSD